MLALRRRFGLGMRSLHGEVPVYGPMVADRKRPAAVDGLARMWLRSHT
ncbi:hypothetical protein CC56_2690 [Bordetella pertussis H934]|nr:hypothetical protein CC56_2690 [Bordetella pertussis H934]